MGTDSLEGLELPVRVVLGLHDEVLLVLVLVVDGSVLGVSLTESGVVKSLGLERDDGRFDSVPVLGLDGSNESTSLISESLILLEADGHHSAEVLTVEGVEDTSLEVGGGGGGNSGVHGGESESGKHCF